MLKPLPVIQGKIAPAFGEPGGGMQILPALSERVNVQWLINNHFIKNGAIEMIVGIREIQSMVNELGVKIGAPKSLLTILSAPADDGAPYIKVDASSYSYVSSERGCEIFNKSTCSLDELLFWIMSRVAQQMAVRYELENRTASGDTRRIYFAKYIQLLGELNSAWAERGRKYVDDVLMISPLLDD